MERCIHLVVMDYVEIKIHNKKLILKIIVVFVKDLFIFLFLNFSENKNLFSCGKNDINQKGTNDSSGVTEPMTPLSLLIIPLKIEFFKNIEIENVF
jgi:hypothetical protein